MLNQLSSGDLIADRRAEYAHMLADSGDHMDAADLMTQALELAPDWAAGWFRLADYEEKSGRKEAAISALHKVLTLNPEDMFGAGLKLALLGDSEAPGQPSSLYVAAAVRRLCRPLRQGACRKARLSRSGKSWRL